MALSYVDGSIGPSTFDDTGGEQTLTTVTPAAHYPMVMILDLSDLADGEAVQLKTYLDMGSGLALYRDELIEGTDPQIRDQQPVPTIKDADARWTLTPVGWAADRDITWLLRRLP